MLLSLTCLLLRCRIFRPTCESTKRFFGLGFQIIWMKMIQLLFDLHFLLEYWYRPFNCLDNYESGDDCLINGRKRSRFDEFFF